MAKNDSILIDGIIAQRLADKKPSNDVGEVFEYFCFEQILKQYDLSDEELEAGWVDGQYDGGIDGFFIFVNGHLVSDTTAAWPRSNAQVDVVVISCKHHDTFKEQTLNNMLATIQELFDLSIGATNFKGKYSAELLKSRSLLARTYEKLAITNPKITLNFVYGSRGDTGNIGESVSARAEQMRHLAASFFSDTVATFTFMGSTELIERYRQVKQFTLELPFQDHLAGPAGGYILIAKLIDYYNFICDAQGNLRRYLFDSNVRDYLGENKVNLDIAASLDDENGPDFLWLNNGVTILATNAVIRGGKNMMMQDIQVVNGLQTTESIYRHFRSGSSRSADRTVSIKIIVSGEEQLRDQIIRATNNQSAIEQAALHATNKIQRDIEQILERHDFYYERRKNYYRNIGKPPERFVTPMYVAAGYVAIIMKQPARAARLKSRFMRNQERYEQVFSESAPIEMWPRLVLLLKAAEREMLGAREGWGERALRSWRGLIVLLYVSKIIGRFSFSASEFCKKIDLDKIDHGLMDVCFRFVEQRRLSSLRQEPSAAFCKDVCKEFGALHSLPGIEALKHDESSWAFREAQRNDTSRLSDEFVDQVDTLLPTQPWSKNIHVELAAKLEVSGYRVQRAITQLVDSGRRKKQVNGILYDAAGSPITGETTAASLASDHPDNEKKEK
ncbi:AIPR family protein [Bradyrhizobium tunisiense]|uniref:AIPR family protein n=1 Tax=Bradyrhizobium tunisiense TaxID=3278709 RepID=UPI0035E2A3B9